LTYLLSSLITTPQQAYHYVFEKETPVSVEKPELKKQFPLLPTLSEDVILTERLCLRPAKAGDAEPLFALSEEPRVIRYLSALKHQFDRPGSRIAFTDQFVIAHRKTESFIGYIALLLEGPEGHRPQSLRAVQGQLHYALRAEEEGNGYMSEAVRAVSAYGFEHHGMARVGAGIQNVNGRSINTVLSAGFERVANPMGGYEDYILPAYKGRRFLRSVEPLSTHAARWTFK
jgi:ribosomal-protein-alanine N-acetyltransferase